MLTIPLATPAVADCQHTLQQLHLLEATLHLPTGRQELQHLLAEAAPCLRQLVAIHPCAKCRYHLLQHLAVLEQQQHMLTYYGTPDPDPLTWHFTHQCLRTALETLVASAA